ncbi:anti-sigma-D factor RsdA [Saccharopolyspora sp. CA-218241]|uniref:anti-sigma-D factor RsdA n=1 Tax=Saccharopolyspora sp. CA-218241 TaxID=3240027 RepID=UPI003D96237D
MTEHGVPGSHEPETPDSEDTGESAGADVLAFRRREDDDASDEAVGMPTEDGFGADDDLDTDDEPVDLSALQADDALLDALGGTNPEVPAADDERPGLDALLVAWRQDVDAAPIGDLVDVETAAAAIEEGKPSRRKLRRRHLVPVATAAAVLMITFTGVGVAARDALPGDMLWGVAQVLYSDHTQAVRAATSARENLLAAEGALEQGQRDEAQAALSSAKEYMRGVDDEHGLSDLQAAHASLAARYDNHEHDQGSAVPPTGESELPPTGTTEPTPTSPSDPNVPPTGSTTPPSSSDDTSESTTSPSETSGSSEWPSSGSSWGSSHDLIPGPTG